MIQLRSSEPFEPDSDAERYLSTAHLDLMAIDERAIPELHRIAMIPAVRRSWRTRGTYIAPEEWAGFLLGRNLFQSYAVERSAGRVVGYTELFDASVLDGYAHLSTYSHPDCWRTGLSVEHVVGTLALAFERFPLRKVVAHLPAENAARLGGLDQLANHVGTLEAHVLIEGHYADVAIYEVTRAGFERARAGRLGAALRPPSGAEPRSASASGRGPTDVLASFDDWVESLPVGADGRLEVGDLDSLHWLEVVDLVETGLGRAIDPGALRAGETLGDIRRFLVAHLTADPVAPRTGRSDRRSP